MMLDLKCMFWFSPQILSRIFLALRRFERDKTTNTCRFSCKVPVILDQNFSESWNYLDRFFFQKKFPNFKLQENPSRGSRVVPCGRTERQKDMRKLQVIAAFRNFVKASKNSHRKLLPSWLSDQSTCVTWQTTHTQGHLEWRIIIFFPFTCWPGREGGRGRGWNVSTKN